MYNPVDHIYEHQIYDFDDTLYKNTLAYNNTLVNETKKNNINNVISQLYSRNKVRNLLNDYIKNTQIEYDMIIMSRFDIDNLPVLQLNNLDVSKVYISNVHFPRKIIPDNFIISSTNIFFQWFDIFDNFKNIIDNYELLKDIQLLGETIDINTEELILANFIFKFKNTNNILYFKMNR
jgi:hypothetical protein